MALSTSMVTVVLVFFQLCSEDYHWWRMSFAIGNGSSIYVFGYAIVYYLLNTRFKA
ncbi:uncharacterized protein BYT42DRAFT_617988 [Radiomyces spectabilis]|uniref:uncharacterized protein n=1 Tax=Radiomyces spectabilis TaxID=64574 RepID=UPI00221F3AD2|nr:uncharacterized protein BYT42DRAFT_617988 [Radiomyces spectabilis]KAI8367567.1 hypothetical protein BYT42DRAFT_617988 [Radiomyces spectabilis]